MSVRWLAVVIGASALLASCIGGKPVPGDELSKCPSSAGCGASIYGTTTLRCAGDEGPMQDAIVLVYGDVEHLDTPTHSATERLVVATGMTDANGAFAIPLNGGGEYRIALVYRGRQQHFDAVNGDKYSGYLRAVTVRGPLALDLHVDQYCID